MIRKINNYSLNWLGHQFLLTMFLMVIIALFMHSCAPMIYRPPDAGPIAMVRPQGNLETKIISILSQPPLNLKICSSHSGAIITESESFEGELHGLLWWKKRWQERTSYKVRVTAGWRPENIQIEVDAYTEQRPNSNYPWEAYDTTKNTQRASKVLNILIEKLGVEYEG